MLLNIANFFKQSFKIRFRQVLLLALVASGISIAQTVYESIALDCGGYFSGFTSHASGRIYGYGDTFGAFRSDDSGTTWKYLLSDLTENLNGGRGIAVASNNADVVYYLVSVRKSSFSYRD